MKTYVASSTRSACRGVFDSSCVISFAKFLVIIAVVVCSVQTSRGQTLAQALNTTNLTWTTSGTSGATGWTADNVTTHDGSLAAQSGQLSSASSTSTLQTITNGPATMTFWWYCPSFNRKLAVVVNNVEIWGIGGNAGWEPFTIYLGSGSQTVKWVYSVFGSGDFQRGYVDQVAFIPGATLPIISTQPRSQSQVQGLNATFSATVVGTPPLAYQWQFNGTNVFAATNSSYTVTNVQAGNLGDYKVVVTNIAGVTDSSNATLEFGNVTAWGWGYAGQTSVARGATNVMGIGGGFYNGMAIKTDGQLLAWGDSGSGQLNIPSDLTNVLAVSVSAYCLALKRDGTVTAWGAGNLGQTNMLQNLSNVVAISVGGNHSMALKSDGTVVAWGENVFGQTNVPVNLSNVVAISAAGTVSVALKSDGTVVAWGHFSSAVTNVPASLTNAVAISTDGTRALAIKSDGSVIGWGTGGFYNLTTPPSGLSNAVAISCGVQHNTVLKSDGTVVVWGANFYGQTNTPSALTNVNAISAGYYHSVALVGNGPPVTTATMTNPTLTTNGFSVSVPSQSGRVYRLEYKTAVSDASWTALPLVAGNGVTLVLTDSSTMITQRVYRVRRW